MEYNKMLNVLLGFLIVVLFILMLIIFATLLIAVRSDYIDLQLKERLLYCGDSYIQEVSIPNDY